jgi:hypothetical protein
MVLLKFGIICTQSVFTKSAATVTLNCLRRYTSQPVKPKKLKAEGFTVSMAVFYITIFTVFINLKMTKYYYVYKKN